MSKPVLLDLFCGAGGAGTGYSRAGFEVVGVDVAPQPHYPFEFFLADAMTFPLEGYDAIHASPPCQHYAPVTKWRGDASEHPDLLEPTVARLRASGVPWVVENVPYAPMQPGCRHRRSDLSFDHGGKQPESAYRDAMGCDWMTVRESRNAIPPTYTEWIGQHLMEQLELYRCDLCWDVFGLADLAAHEQAEEDRLRTQRWPA